MHFLSFFLFSIFQFHIEFVEFTYLQFSNGIPFSAFVVSFSFEMPPAIRLLFYEFVEIRNLYMSAVNTGTHNLNICTFEYVRRINYMHEEKCGRIVVVVNTSDTSLKEASCPFVCCFFPKKKLVWKIEGLGSIEF